MGSVLFICPVIVSSGTWELPEHSYHEHSHHDIPVCLFGSSFNSGSYCLPIRSKGLCRALRWLCWTCWVWWSRRSIWTRTFGGTCSLLKHGLNDARIDRIMITLVSPSL